MADRRDRECVPIEMEMIPLYREPGWSVRLQREQKREQKREQRHRRRRSPGRMLARLATRARASTRRRPTC